MWSGRVLKEWKRKEGTPDEQNMWHIPPDDSRSLRETERTQPKAQRTEYTEGHRTKWGWKTTWYKRSSKDSFLRTLLWYGQIFPEIKWECKLTSLPTHILRSKLYKKEVLNFYKRSNRKWTVLVTTLEGTLKENSKFQKQETGVTSL